MRWGEGFSIAVNRALEPEPSMRTCSPVSVKGRYTFSAPSRAMPCPCAPTASTTALTGPASKAAPVGLGLPCCAGERFFIAVLPQDWRAQRSANGPSSSLYACHHTANCLPLCYLIFDNAALAYRRAPRFELGFDQSREPSISLRQGKKYGQNFEEGNETDIAG